MTAPAFLKYGLFIPGGDGTVHIDANRVAAVSFDSQETGVVSVYIDGQIIKILGELEEVKVAIEEATHDSVQRTFITNQVDPEQGNSLLTQIRDRLFSFVK